MRMILSMCRTAMGTPPLCALSRRSATYRLDTLLRSNPCRQGRTCARILDVFAQHVLRNRLLVGVVERGGGVPHVPAGGALLRLQSRHQARPAPRVPQLGGGGGAHMAPRDELGEALVHHGIHRVAQHAQNIEPLQDGIREFHVLREGAGGVVPSPEGIGGGDDAAARLEGDDNARLGDMRGSRASRKIWSRSPAVRPCAAPRSSRLSTWLAWMCGTDPRYRPRSHRPAVGPVVRGLADGPRLGRLRGGGDGRRESPGKQQGRAREGHHGGGATRRLEHPVAEDHQGAPGGVCQQQLVDQELATVRQERKSLDRIK
mmetsp:Transcript_22373/g.44781  ORF Transcript_22373/g.44781 Transcript_22373/m.44781 type:complete len:316 (-) Transcript_22373:185-1132(-)